jgi:hypothetical protein
VIELIDRIGFIFNNGASKLKLFSTSYKSMSGADILIISLSEICKILFREKRSLLIKSTQAFAEQWLTDIVDRNIRWIVEACMAIFRGINLVLGKGFFCVQWSELKEWGSGGSSLVILIFHFSYMIEWIIITSLNSILKE